MPAATSFTSAPSASQMFAISLMKEIFVARKAFEAYLIISAVRRSVITIGARSGKCNWATSASGFAIERAEHRARRVLKIENGRALTQEFRAGDNGEGDRLRLVGADDVRHPVARPHRHRRFVDDDEGVLHGLGNRLSRRAHVLQIRLAIHALRRAHRDERELGGPETPRCRRW